MNILLIGPPGSGKGTQGGRVANALGLEHIAVGDVLRAEVADRSPLGRGVAEYVERGELAPDELVMQLVVPRALAASARSGYVLDGFPRSVRQAVAARKLAEPAHTRPDLVVYLDVPQDVLVRRLIARGQAQGRGDDTDEAGSRPSSGRRTGSDSGRTGSWGSSCSASSPSMTQMSVSVPPLSMLMSLVMALRP